MKKITCEMGRTFENKKPACKNCPVPCIRMRILTGNAPNNIDMKEAALMEELACKEIYDFQLLFPPYVINQKFLRKLKNKRMKEYGLT